ncbi:ferredoxin protein [Oryzomicrobium terrae]|uniref:Epoxyqueuosine reductase n=1 Tax=Oryzomicrobium terrae TaxID=1735038 RepID=A0A5C1E7K5_9RHOO|nr:ferredoxin protein [Oryzomicrobium terrae]
MDDRDAPSSPDGVGAPTAVAGGAAPDHPRTPDALAGLPGQIRGWAGELGFASAHIGRARISPAAQAKLTAWLAAGCHGEMDYMARHADLRAAPDTLVPGALSVISVRLPYWPEGEGRPVLPAEQALTSPHLAYVSRYALGRDYHKVVRNRLQKLADRIAAAVGPHGYRVFSDSAPVMEVELASKNGLGWRGKHTLLLTRQGSYHFLGEILTDLPLPIDPPPDNNEGDDPDSPAGHGGHCGDCQRCLPACPTGAITAPYQMDARRCISYLTIELHGAIPEDLRPLMGNRIYGCDDCQLACPWNRFAHPGDPDFAPRNGLDGSTLAQLFAWSAEDFEQRLAGSPIRRIGWERWLRNIAVALGNAPTSPEVIAALVSRRDHPAELVREHVTWALRRHGQ